MTEETNMAEETRSCVNCDHCHKFYLGYPFLGAMCKSPLVGFDPVDGSKNKSWCSNQRDGETNGYCGASGRWFKPRRTLWQRVREWWG